MIWHSLQRFTNLVSKANAKLKEAFARKAKSVGKGKGSEWLAHSAQDINDAKLRGTEMQWMCNSSSVDSVNVLFTEAVSTDNSTGGGTGRYLSVHGDVPSSILTQTRMIKRTDFQSSGPRRKAAARVGARSRYLKIEKNSQASQKTQENTKTKLQTTSKIRMGGRKRPRVRQRGD